MTKTNLSRLISPKSIAVVGNRGADFAIRESQKLGFTGKYGLFIQLEILLKV